MDAFWGGGDGVAARGGLGAGWRTEKDQELGGWRPSTRRPVPPRHGRMVRVAGGGGKRPRKLGDGQGSPLTMCGRA